jgi:hypothetical protein
MEIIKSFPTAIKLMIILIFIDVIATLMFFYFDTLFDPDIGFFDLESLVSFIIPPIYLAGMIWLIRSHSQITKIIIYIVFALELASFMIFGLEAPGFDIFSILSLVSTLALFGCIYVLNTDVGKKWFAVNENQ